MSLICVYSEVGSRDPSCKIRIVVSQSSSCNGSLRAFSPSTSILPTGTRYAPWYFLSWEINGEAAAKQELYAPTLGETKNRLTSGLRRKRRGSRSENVFTAPGCTTTQVILFSATRRWRALAVRLVVSFETPEGGHVQMGKRR